VGSGTGHSRRYINESMSLLHTKLMTLTGCALLVVFIKSQSLYYNVRMNQLQQQIIDTV